MADLSIANAAALTAATAAENDLVPMLDVSAAVNSKGSKITVAELRKLMLNTVMQALAGLNADLGLLEQTGAATFTKRAMSAGGLGTDDFNKIPFYGENGEFYASGSVSAVLDGVVATLDSVAVTVATHGDGAVTIISDPLPTGFRIIHLPDASGTFALIALAQTLTNKTIDALSNTLTHLPETHSLIVGDTSTPLTAGATKGFLQLPYAFVITGVAAVVKTAPTGGPLTFDINVGTDFSSMTSILSTKLTVDPGETSSHTAATPAVISSGTWPANYLLTVDIDQPGLTIAGAWPLIVITGYRG